MEQALEDLEFYRIKHIRNSYLFVRTSCRIDPPHSENLEARTSLNCTRQPRPDRGLYSRSGVMRGRRLRPPSIRDRTRPGRCPRPANPFFPRRSRQGWLGRFSQNRHPRADDFEHTVRVCVPVASAVRLVERGFPIIGKRDRQFVGLSRITDIQELQRNDFLLAEPLRS